MSKRWGNGSIEERAGEGIGATGVTTDDTATASSASPACLP